MTPRRLRRAREARFYGARFVDSPFEDYSDYRNLLNNNITELTFAPTGAQLIRPQFGMGPNMGVMYNYGASARALRARALAVNYVVNFGSYAAQTSEMSGVFDPVTVNSAGVDYNLGIQVIWVSSVEMLESERRIAKVSVDHNFYTLAPFGAVRTASDFNMGSTSRRSLVIDVDPQAYTRAALSVIRETNAALVAAMAAQR